MAQGTGSITGRVTDEIDGTPIRGVRFSLEGGATHAQAESDNDGQFAFQDIPAGGPYVLYTRFASDNGHVDEIWQDRPCSREYGCDLSNADPVTVVANQTAAGFDFGLSRLGSIEGDVRQALSGALLPNIGITVWYTDGGFAGSTSTDAFGHYQIRALFPGTVVALTRFSETVVDEIFDNHPCAPSCDLAQGDPITINLGETSVADFALDPGGRIEGTTIDAGSGLPAAQIDVYAWDLANENVVRTAQSDTSGRYAITALPPGSYLVISKSSDRFAGTLYENVPCPGNRYNLFRGCSPNDGRPIIVGRNQTVSGITLRLQELGMISGHVTRAEDGLPLANVGIQLLGDNGSDSATTDSAGRYQIGGLAPGTYFVVSDGYGTDRLDVVWSNTLCSQCNAQAEGSPIIVDFSQHVEGIDLALPKGASISGRVFNGISLEPIRSALIELFDQEGNFVRNVFSHSDGTYRLDRLEPGVNFARVNEYGFANQLWNGVPCDGDCDPTTGTPIPLDFGDTADGIDFALDFPAGILGRVTHAETGDPLTDVQVILWNANGNIFNSVSPSETGSYQFIVTPGTYFVSTESWVGPEHSGIDEVYDNVPCPPASSGGCRPFTGTPITITESTVATDIDFALEGFSFRTCQPSSEHLCLAAGRFLVTATWRAPDGRTGRAGAERLTDESGYFWFFRPGNVEAIVKVLDACGAATPRFWTFAAGLTNLEVDLTVVDTFTNEIKTYHNGAGIPFEPIQDTRAFDTCDMYYDPFLRPAPPPAPMMAIATPEDRLPVAKGTGCTPGDTALCLGPDGRFRVEANWRRFDEGTGVARAVPLAPSGSGDTDTGYMWFFRSDNVEVVVKVLDACDSASHRFWVFAGGLTNVQVDLRVTDTVTGEVKSYFNQLGQPFQPIVDTRAFDTCDAP